MPAALVQPWMVETIKKRYPEWDSDGYICVQDLQAFGSEHVQEVIQRERGELTELESEVLEMLRQHELVAKNLNQEYNERRKFAARLADRLAGFTGSWWYIGLMIMVTIVWVTFNAVQILGRQPFDPYPYIFLNLCLNVATALQGPVIMMSQNREVERDRLRADNEYKVNLKSELEIRMLTQKMNLLMDQKWQRLLEIQELQLEMLEQRRPAHQPRRKVSIDDVIGKPA